MSEKDIYGFTSEEVDLIKKTVGKEAVNDDELKRFLYRAHKMGLNPLDGTIHLLTRNRKTEAGKWEKVNVIIVGIDGFRIAANRSGQLAGIKREAVYSDKGQVTRAVAEIHRKDWEHPATESLAFREYCQHKGGTPVGLWASMPETMLKKCAEAAALRMAFASELAGVYIPEEMGEEEVPETKKTKKATKPSAEEKPAEEQPAEKPAKEPVKEAPAEKSMEKPTEEPSTEPPAERPAKVKSSKKADDVPEETQKFDGKLIIIETPQDKEHETFGPYQEVKAFDAISEKTYTLIGKSFATLKQKDVIHVTGEVKGDKMKPATLKVVTHVVTEKPESEPESLDAPADAPDDILSDVIIARLTTEPAVGRKTFGDKLEEVVWARAENGDKKYVIVAHGEVSKALSSVKKDDTINIKGETVTETNGVFIYATEVTASAEAVA